MTAAKVMDIISRLPGYDGQAADAVSAYSQVKMEDASKLLKIPISEKVQTFGFVYHDTHGLNHGPVWKIQLFLLNGTCTVILWQDLIGKGNVRKSYRSTVGTRFQIGNACSYTVKKGLFLSLYVDDIKNGWNEAKLFPTWKILMQDVDLGQPTSFLDHVFWGCSENVCQRSKDIVANHREMFEYRISARATEKPPTRASGKLDAETTSSWSYDMEGHAKKCVERYCELANKTTEQLCNVATPMQGCSSIQRTNTHLETCPQFAHKLFVNVYIWHVLRDLILCGL